MGLNAVREAVEAIRQGKTIIVRDDEDRENEGDLTMAAEKVTPEAVNFMARYGRGLICLAMTPERLDQLQLPQMVEKNDCRYGTAFTVSVEARRGVTTGISAADRATTILTAVHPETTTADLVRPGHVFPLRARPGGVLERAGQTEAAVDLARMAGLYPAGVICEIMNEDGTMARGPELEEVARTHGLKMISVADIIAFRLMTETFLRKVAESQLATRFGNFRVLVFENALDGEHHVALVKGEISGTEPTLVRVQEQMTLRDVFGCPSGGGNAEMVASFRAIEKEGRGVFVYLRLEGKGSSLVGEVKGCLPESPEPGAAYSEFPPPLKEGLRTYGVGAQILRELGVRRIRLLSNHPRKIVALQGFGIAVSEQVPLEIGLAASGAELPGAGGKPAGSAAGRV